MVAVVDQGGSTRTALVDVEEQQLGQHLDVGGIAKSEIRVGIDVRCREGKRERAGVDRGSPHAEQLAVVFNDEPWKQPIELAAVFKERQRVLARPWRKVRSVESCRRHQVLDIFEKEVEVEMRTRVIRRRAYEAVSWRGHRRSNATSGIDRRAVPSPVGVLDRDKRLGVVKELIENAIRTLNGFRVHSRRNGPARLTPPGP